jgi:hypothetical protein
MRTECGVTFRTWGSIAGENSLLDMYLNRDLCKIQSHDLHPFSPKSTTSLRFTAMFAYTLGLTALFSSAFASSNADNTAVVDLSVNTGATKHLASGAIYGVPNTQGQIPDKFYQDMGYNYGRAGGGQLTEGGWVVGLAAYQARFTSAMENYRTAREFGADFILLPHDLWGTDHANSTTHWPGDNGDWTDYEKFLAQVFGDLKFNDMLDGMVYDTWNEPDGGYFWKRGEAQYLEMWDRTYRKIRNDASLNKMQITGPSAATPPGPSNSWWVDFVENMVANKTIPDWYSWHEEPGDLDVDIPNLNKVLDAAKAPQRPVNINEYAAYSQQVPAGSAWFISRLERWNANGLRGNWRDGCQLYDFLASLLTKTDINDCVGEGYQANSDYTTYQYYYLNMTGHRAGTTSSGDGSLDAYATVGPKKVRTLAGVVDSQIGTWYLTIDNLSSVGLKKSGDLAITTLAFENSDHFTASKGPKSHGATTYAYSGNSVTIAIHSTAAQNNTAWAFEFST